MFNFNFLPFLKINLKVLVYFQIDKKNYYQKLAKEVFINFFFHSLFYQSNYFKNDYYVNLCLIPNSTSFSEFIEEYKTYLIF